MQMNRALRIAPIVLALLAAAPARAARPEKAFVVIVANNRSLTPGVAPLRWADDDGARWYELLAPIAARISLFTVLDDESQRLFRGPAAVAEAPTAAALRARLAAYNVEMDAARAAGADPVLYLVFVGHGEIGAGGEGYLSLLDAPLTRTALLHDVIAPSRAAYNHLIIDACNAWLLVAKRGDDRASGKAAAAVRAWVEGEDLDRFPSTGLLLSTSRAQATHEWSAYGGGVFSHEVRSALAGAADVNGDGRVEYSEVHAFIAAANLRVDDPRARLDVFARPPALDHGRALVDLGASRFRHFARLPAEAQGRYAFEDARGVRYADVNKTAERPLLVALVDSAHYFVRTDEAELILPLDAPGARNVTIAELRPRAAAARGPVEESFRRHLFEVGFGPAFYRGFVASAGAAPVVDPPGARFEPPAAFAEDAPALRLRLDAARRRATERRPSAPVDAADDRFISFLIEWAGARLAAGDLREAARAIATLERRLAGS